MTPAPPLSLEAVFAEMKVRTQSRRPLIVRLTVFFALVSALIGIGGAGGAFGQAVSLGLSLLVGVIYTAMIIQLLCVPGGDKDVAGLWKSIAPLLGRLVWVTLVAAVGMLIGMAMLIVPGLILLTLWSVAQQALVAERTGVFESLGRSRELVRGNGLRVFLFLLLLGLMALMALTLALLVAAPFGSGIAGIAVSSFTVALLVSPLTSIGAAALYNCLSGGSLADAATTGPTDMV